MFSPRVYEFENLLSKSTLFLTGINISKWLKLCLYRNNFGCQTALIALEKCCYIISLHQLLLTLKGDLFPVSKTLQACTCINTN